MIIEPGTQIKSYQIIELIGRGGMAEVYRARHVDLDVDVSIKFIRMERFPQEMLPNIVKRFQNEAKRMAKLSHPNIVKVTDYGSYKNVPYFVMEYLPGGTLKQYLGTPMPYQEAAKLLLPISDALCYAHSKGVVHRDVKPANILIAENIRPMLSDFGVAKMVDTEETQGLTATGVSIGTPEYMAPEQAMGKKIDYTVDIYSLGVIFFELLTGHRPYQAETPIEVVFKQMQEEIPSPTMYVEEIPAQVEEMLTLALAKSPSDRYVDMNVFATNLEKLVFDIQLPEVNNQKISYSIDAINIPEQDNSRRVSKIDGMTMIYIPGGEFEMGSVEGREDEQPVHTVYLDPYWIDETEVTNKMFAKFLNENGNKSEKGSKWFFDNSPYTPISKISGRWQVEEGFEDHPVVEVNWYGAYAYSQWAGRRLPTEAEWEKAARGTNGWKFPWGNHKPDKTLLNFYSKVGMTTPVRSYLDGASIYGVLDMAGNVWEYVVDWYDPDYYKSLQETRWRNPKGPQSGTYKVGRGGSWINGIDFVRSTSRISLDPYTADMNIGFRCVLEA